MSLWFMVGCTIQSFPGPEWDLSGSSLMSLVHVQEQFCGEALTCSVQCTKHVGNMWVAQCTCTYMYVVCDPVNHALLAYTYYMYTLLIPNTLTCEKHTRTQIAHLRVPHF